MTPSEVLKSWWATVEGELYHLNLSYKNLDAQLARIECNGCGIAWITSKRSEPFFEYATEHEGEVFKIQLADPSLFEKLTKILETASHSCRAVRKGHHRI